MNFIGIIIGILVAIGAAFGVYKASTMFTLGDVVKSQSVKVDTSIQSAKDQANTTIQSGKQYIASGLQNVVASGQALLDQKKGEAQDYLIQQKEILKQEAQKKLEEEAKKKIKGVLDGL